MTAPGVEGVLAEVLARRIRDWQESSSETYAQMSGDNDVWVNGLVGYLLHGPGALLSSLAEWAQQDEVVERGATAHARECAPFGPGPDSHDADIARAVLTAIFGSTS